MTCRECDCSKRGYFASKPDAWVCLGVQEPFVIENMDRECTEYQHKRQQKVYKKNPVTLNYGLVMRFRDGTDLYYEPLTDEIDGFVLRANDGDMLKSWTPVNHILF